VLNLQPVGFADRTRWLSQRFLSRSFRVIQPVIARRSDASEPRRYATSSLMIRPVRCWGASTCTVPMGTAWMDSVLVTTGGLETTVRLLRRRPLTLTQYPQ